MVFHASFQLGFALLSVVMPASAVRAGSKAVGPPDAPAAVRFEPKTGRLTVVYCGDVVFDGTARIAGAATGRPVQMTANVESGIRGITQSLVLSSGEPGLSVRLEGKANAGAEGIAAETLGSAQQAFKCIRTTVGRSSNRRNNAIYCRGMDWMLEGPQGGTRIVPASGGSWTMLIQSPAIQLVFRPRFYQRHKNIRFFEPWNYRVWSGSVTGWCSWWAYFGDVDEKAIQAVVDVFDRKHLKDYGYRYIQIDDGYQTEPKGSPENWLNWRRKKFPSGIDGYVKAIRSKGLEPAIWVSAGTSDIRMMRAHPDWFVPGADGKPLKGPWIDYPLDASNPDALRAIVSPLFQELKRKGFKYVKIDTLRHLLYDGYYHAAPGHFEGRDLTAETAFRRYVETAREALGRDTYVLSCWGVLPEGVGVVDGCRLGGDGYGPATMQQYNSWNGIVWRSDPDHCDVLPERESHGDFRDTIVRPVLASMAGAMLMISDKPAVYEDDRNLEGVRRAAPVLFSVPGQLYDYDPRKSDALIRIDGHRQESGGGSGPIDADQFGEACEWWQQEIAKPFETWNVLARFSWDRALPATKVTFKDIGLDPAKRYAVTEFWSGKTLGVFRGSFPADAQDAKGVRVYAIREKLDRPQVLSTNRHISQGGVDLLNVKWDGTTETLSGQSAVVVGDRYTITVSVPRAYRLLTARFGDGPATIEPGHTIARISFTPAKTGKVDWSVTFEK